MSAFGKLADGFSINPITGDSGADRLVPSELFSPSYESLGFDISHELVDIGS